MLLTTRWERLACTEASNGVCSIPGVPHDAEPRPMTGVRRDAFKDSAPTVAADLLRACACASTVGWCIFTVEDEENAERFLNGQACVTGFWWRTAAETDAVVNRTLGTCETECYTYGRQATATELAAAFLSLYASKRGADVTTFLGHVFIDDCYLQPFIWCMWARMWRFPSRITDRVLPIAHVGRCETQLLLLIEYSKWFMLTHYSNSAESVQWKETSLSVITFSSATLRVYVAIPFCV